MIAKVVLICVVFYFSTLSSTCHSNNVPPRLRLAHVFENVMIEQVSNGSGTILQIGAHTGFEWNDPIWKLLQITLKKIDRLHHNLTWVFVEPVPNNVRSLKQNLKSYMLPKGCNVLIAEVAISDQKGGHNHTTFFSISDSIDPRTGYDKLTRKQLPAWVSQIGSFNRQHILKHSRTWRLQGLDVRNYIRPIRVPVYTIQGVLSTRGIQLRDVGLLLVDTEGYDCKILLSQNFDENNLRPALIVFEYMWCKRQRNKVHKHLQSFGYLIFREDRSNDFAILKPAEYNGAVRV
ncbi:methyltransferase FkbM domain-containing protein [Pseudoscourfieldia marina]